ncbi:MAG: phosphatidylserine decarboxylase family protein [Proteobacteria bacterium]|nr:phosphatidylserine decarboxylase family protein [Pseudomonadota bacterium]
MNSFSWPEKPGMTAFPIARPGYPFIIAAALITFLLALIGFSFLSFISLVLTLFICFFFRDPDRVIQDREGAVSSPADGKVIIIENMDENPFFEGPCKKISIFMSVFNVHVNRIPFTGTISEIRYFPGKFVNASLDKASSDNERNALIIETDKGIKYATVQIAGLIARRIICGVQAGDMLRRGVRFGLICFGSRLDVYLPSNAEVAVTLGDKVQAGTSIIGYINHG